jgi:uncharacterized cupredoxin-like copper-binding protein
MLVRLPQRIALTALCLAAPLALAACGGGDDSSSSTAAESTSSTTAAGNTGQAPATGGGETVKVGETEYQLSPSTVNVKPGEVTFDVSNDGQVTHNLEVEGPTGDQEIEGDLAPGDSGTLTVDLSKPGTYEMYCPVDSHKDQGMTGEVVVKG